MVRVSLIQIMTRHKCDSIELFMISAVSFALAMVEATMCVTGSSSNIRFNALSLAQLVFYQLGYVFCHRQQFPSVYSPHVLLKSAQSCGDTSIFDLFAAGCSVR